MRQPVDNHWQPVTGQSELLEKIKKILSWFLGHRAWAGIGAIATIIIGILSLSNQHNSDPVSSSRSRQKNCIKNPIQIMSQNKELNLSRSSNCLSGCYVDGCYTYQLTITDLVETDISNQFLKGLDWHVGVSMSERKAGGRTHSTVIKIRSNGRSLDEIRNKSAFKLDEKVYVWLDSLNICNKEKRK